LRIALVEDDPLQAEWIANELWRHSSRIAIRYFDSEHSFRENLSGLKEAPPHMFLFDLMLRYYGAEDLEKMDEIPDANGLPSPQMGGLRIAHDLRKTDSLREVPIILMSAVANAIPNDDLPERSMFWHKGEELGDLIRAIRSISASLGVDLPSKPSALSRAGEAAELKPGFMGMSVDLKKVWDSLRGTRANKRLHDNP
jgi:CheY-like chemotaxis protein